MQIMLHGQMGQQSIAEKPFGKNPRRSRGEGALTAAAVALLQFIANNLLAHGVHFDNGARFAAFGIQRAAAVRATPRPRHRALAGDLIIGNAAAPVPAMAGLGPAPTQRAFQRCIGLERDFGRRSRGAKGTFLGGPFLMAQTSFEANDFFLQPVDDQLLLQAPWAIGRLEFRKVYSGVGASRCWRCWRKLRGNIRLELFPPRGAGLHKAAPPPPLLLMIRRPPRSTLFPYKTLFR